MKKDNSGPAFPVEHPDYARHGMSLRDYFAAHAMQGICAHHDTWGLLIEHIADRSYQIADAMLATRSA